MPGILSDPQGQSGCVKNQTVGKTLKDKAWQVANEGAYMGYVTDICNLSQRSKPYNSLQNGGFGVLTQSAVPAGFQIPTIGLIMAIIAMVAGSLILLDR